MIGGKLQVETAAEASERFHRLRRSTYCLVTIGRTKRLFAQLFKLIHALKIGRSNIKAFHQAKDGHYRARSIFSSLSIVGG